MGLTPTIPDAVGSLRAWVDAGVFGPAEVHGAEVLTRAMQGAGAPIHLAAALALWAPLHGHSCVHLGRVRQQVEAVLAVTLANEAEQTGSGQAVGERDTLDRGDADEVDERLGALPWPDADDWNAELGSSPIVRVVDAADLSPVLDERPLVLSGDLVYTQRQWIDECSVAGQLRDRAATAASAPVSGPAADLLEMLMPPTATDGSGHRNLQYVAALAALTSQLTVIVGGPGTGKTHAVARILAVMLTDASARGAALRVGLVAPTGKAAAAMREAIASAAADGLASGHLAADQVSELVDLPTSTIHRLLGSIGSSTRFVHRADKPLPLDVVIVDESSMVSLPLMARLLEAVRPGARIVLVGDPDQLHSIEVGAVLADIVSAAADTSSPLHDRVIRLRHQHRQQSGSPVGPLAEAVRDGRSADVVAQLAVGFTDGLAVGFADGLTEPVIGRQALTFIEHSDPLATAGAAGIAEVVTPTLVAAAASARQGDAVRALSLFASVRVLCAHRRGPHGVQQWNRAIESWVLDHSVSGVPPRFYPGRAILATRNDQRQQIANGDTGIVIEDPAGVRAAFGTAVGMRILAPAQLAGLETAFATTVHKSQGSEYATVVVVLPPATSPLASRELLYTAITRSTDRLVIIGTQAALVACVESPSRRVTGLESALRRRASPTPAIGP